MIREGRPVAGVNCARHIRINQDKKPTKRFNAVGVGEGWARWAGSSLWTDSASVCKRANMIAHISYHIS